MAKKQSKTITEGMVKKGGLNSQPKSRPVRPAAQSVTNQSNQGSGSSSSNSGSGSGSGGGKSD